MTLKIWHKQIIFGEILGYDRYLCNRDISKKKQTA